MLSALSFTTGFLRFREREFLFNNTRPYASEKERAGMNKKPYSRQLAIVFSGIGLLFLMIALANVTGWVWLMFVITGLIILLIAYAVISSVRIEIKRK